MRDVLRNPSYAKLFSAQIVALLGTGMLTVALGLLAFDIAGGDAGVVLGTALTIKIVAYVAVAPVIAAVTSHLPRKPLLVGADLLRAGVALSLPFVTEVWQIYVLIFVLQAASATFTPAFQAVIPEVLPDERQYTRALSLSRLACDLEALVSPVIAAALLVVVTYNNLFLGTFLGFLGSMVLVLVTRFPPIRVAEPAPFFARLTRGAQVFLRSAELRSLLAMNLVVATATAMVLVNTVVLVQGELSRGASDVAWLLAAYGAGSMAVALALPTLLDRSSDRPFMLAGAMALPVLLVASWATMSMTDAGVQWVALLALWVAFGAATSLVLTPSARLLRRASDETNRPAVFAAQFSLSHACYLLTYPLAGALGAAIGLPMTAVVLAMIGGAGAIAAALLWRSTPDRAGRPVTR